MRATRRSWRQSRSYSRAGLGGKKKKKKEEDAEWRAYVEGVIQRYEEFTREGQEMREVASEAVQRVVEANEGVARAIIVARAKAERLNAVRAAFDKADEHARRLDARMARLEEMWVRELVMLVVLSQGCK